MLFFYIKSESICKYVVLFSRLSKMGQDVGIKLIDLYFVREKNCKREVKLQNMLLFVRSTLWKVSKFGVKYWLEKIANNSFTN